MNQTFDQIIHYLNPQHDVFAKGITINDSWPLQILKGRVEIKPDISRFRKIGVEFEDGSYEDIDSVIMATGYEIDLPIDSSVIPIERNQFHLYRNVFPPHLEHPTLAIIGLVLQGQNGSVNPISEMQSRWVARVLKGICKLPSRQDMERSIRNHIELKKTSTTAAKACLMVDTIPYLDELATDIGSKPQLGQLLMEDPMFALRCFFGPSFPYQYRLMGPGKWEGAKSAIETAWTRMENGGQPSIQKRGRDTSIYRYMMMLIVLISLFLCFYVT